MRIELLLHAQGSVQRRWQSCELVSDHAELTQGQARHGAGSVACLQALLTLLCSKLIRCIAQQVTAHAAHLPGNAIARLAQDEAGPRPGQALLLLAPLHGTTVSSSLTAEGKQSGVWMQSVMDGRVLPQALLSLVPLPINTSLSAAFDWTGLAYVQACCCVCLCSRCERVLK